MSAKFGKAIYIKLPLGDGAANAPRPMTAANKDAGAARGPRAPQSGVPQQRLAPLPSQTETPGISPIKVTRAVQPGPPHRPPQADPSDGAIKVARDRPAEASDARASRVVRDDPGVVAAPAREQRSQPGLVLDVPPMEPHTPWQDETLSIKTIAACAAVVIAVGFGFVTLLPSLLTFPTNQSTVALAPRPARVQPAQTKPLPAPEPESAELRGAAIPSPASEAPIAVAKNAPALSETAGAPSQTQPAKPTTAASSNAGNTTPGGIALPAGEKAAIARGRRASEKTAPAAAPRRTASARPPLTAEEKAAIDRGLKELAKAAGKPPP